jgi:hypothetical protein
MMSEQNKNHPIKLIVGGIIGAICGFVVAGGFVFLCLLFLDAFVSNAAIHDAVILCAVGCFLFLGVLLGGYWGALIGGGKNSIKAWLVASGICLVVMLAILIWLCAMFFIAFGRGLPI